MSTSDFDAFRYCRVAIVASVYWVAPAVGVLAVTMVECLLGGVSRLSLCLDRR